MHSGDDRQSEVPIGARLSPLLPDGSKKRLSSRISYDQFLTETTIEERSILFHHLELAIISFIERSIPVYLEGFGIIFPEQRDCVSTLADGSRNILRQERLTSLNFEKCSELIPFQQERYKGIVGLKDLSMFMQTAIAPLASWDEAALRRLVKGAILAIKHEVISAGSFNKFRTIGEFCCLHNRQGTSFIDWFAGADIFLIQSYCKSEQIRPDRVVSRPLLENAWELMIAAHGKPIRYLEIDFVKELYEIEAEKTLSQSEYAVSLGIDYEARHIKTAVFRTEGYDNTSVLIFCSDGLRHAIDSELVFQVEFDPSDLKLSEVVDSQLDCLVSRVFSLGLVLAGMKSKLPRIGSGIQSDLPLFKGLRTSLSGIIVSEFSKARLEQQVVDGSFYYRNLVGITAEETQILTQFSGHYLLKFLKIKGLDQVTKILRQSIFHRTFHACPAKVPENSRNSGSSPDTSQLL